jgi:hypothetical protein
MVKVNGIHCFLNQTPFSVHQITSQTMNVVILQHFVVPQKEVQPQKRAAYHTAQLSITPPMEVINVSGFTIQVPHIASTHVIY